MTEYTVCSRYIPRISEATKTYGVSSPTTHTSSPALKNSATAARGIAALLLQFRPKCPYGFPLSTYAIYSYSALFFRTLLQNIFNVNPLIG